MPYRRAALCSVLLLAAAAFAAPVISVGEAEDAMLDVDSVRLGTRSRYVTYETPGFSCPPLQQDTFIFGDTVRFPASAYVIYHVGGLRLPPFLIDTVCADTWYDLPDSGLSFTAPRIKFGFLTVGVDAPDARSVLCLRPVRSPTAGPVRFTTCLPAGITPALEVYDGAGLLVRRLSGLVWDRRDSDGRRVAGGVYLVRLIAGDRQAMVKVVLTE